SVGDGLLGDIDAQHFGLKFAAEYRSVVLTLAATKTLDKDGIINPWGGSPSFASKMISNFDRPGELALRTVLSTDFGEHLPGLSGLLSFAHGETEDGDKFPQQDEFDVTIDYKPPWLEELWLRVRGGW
ncbi:MAG: OprD family porin, partial [Akkermansiaceae bacterium]|nr:OprD family porin [Akkermansiaceae bacterium]